jgi:hypothetical protein
MRKLVLFAVCLTIIPMAAFGQLMQSFERQAPISSSYSSYTSAPQQTTPQNTTTTSSTYKPTVAPPAPASAPTTATTEQDSKVAHDAKWKRRMECFKYCDGLSCHPNDPRCVIMKLDCRTRCIDD